MNRVAVFFLLIIAPALALVLGVLGLETLKDNLLGWVLLVIGVAYPAGAVILVWIRKQAFWQSAGPARSEERGDLSFWLLVPGMLAVCFAAPLEYMYLDAYAWLPRAVWMQALGLGLVALGLLLRLWTRSAIRGAYSGHIQVTHDQILVTGGPYALIRHPGYLGLLLLTLGIALGYSGLIALIAVPVLVLPGLAYRIHIEERLLRESFGEPYRKYARRTKRLVPFIW